MSRTIAIVSLAITVFLFASVMLIGRVMGDEREKYLDSEFERLQNDFSSIQSLFLMSNTYDSEMACLAFEEKLEELDTYIWKLGEKIDDYRAASEEFQKDQYYLKQKEIFNENEVFYFLMLRNMINECNMNKKIILFFYQNSKDCKKCDDQSFILSDIKEIDEDMGNQEVAIFSFDMDLGLSTISVLNNYYEINQYPCLVIGENTYCGIQDKKVIMNKICNNPAEELAVCEKYYQ